VGAWRSDGVHVYIPGGAPSTALHDLAERLTVGLRNVPERPGGRIAEGQQERYEMLLVDPLTTPARSWSRTIACPLPRPRSVAAIDVANVAWPRS